LLTDIKYFHIIWDWNGTLLDDAWLFVDVMNEILHKRNMNTITLSKYREVFEFPIRNYYHTLGFNLDKESFGEIGSEFINIYNMRRFEANLHSQSLQLLHQIQILGINNYILSAQQQTILDELTKYYKIKQKCIYIEGAKDHYAYGKIKNGMKLIKNNNIIPNECLLIGDTDHDSEVANAIGIDCILVSHGHQSYSRLIKTGAPVINNLTEIFNLFNIEQDL